MLQSSFFVHVLLLLIISRQPRHGLEYPMQALKIEHGCSIRHMHKSLIDVHAVSFTLHITVSRSHLLTLVHTNKLPQSKSSSHSQTQCSLAHSTTEMYSKLEVFSWPCKLSSKIESNKYFLQREMKCIHFLLMV